MKKTIRVISALLACVVISGCASIPDMNEDQAKVVSEYAASLMLKYDAENHSRLVDTADFINEYTAKKLAFEMAANKYWEEIKKQEEAALEEENQRREETSKQEQLSSQDNGREPYDNGGATVIDKSETNSLMEIDEYIGLSNFSIQYSGYNFCKTLTSDSAFDLSAGPGKDLLILSFDVKNLSSQSEMLDILTKKVSFKISINNGKYISALISTNDNDLAQAYVKFDGGESRNLILIAEVPESTDLETLSLSVDMAEKDTIVKLLK